MNPEAGAKNKSTRTQEKKVFIKTKIKDNFVLEVRGKARKSKRKAKKNPGHFSDLRQDPFKKEGRETPLPLPRTFEFRRETEKKPKEKIRSYPGKNQRAFSKVKT